MQNWGFYTLLTELPTYMKNILHFNIEDNSAVSALPYFLALIVSILFSPVADFIIGKTDTFHSLVRIDKGFIYSLYRSRTLGLS